MKKGKPLMTDALDQGVCNPLRVSCKKPCDKRSPVGEGKERCIQWSVLAALGRNFGFETDRRTGRRLAFGEAVDRVVKEKVLDIDIPSRHVRQMPSSDPQAVAVASTANTVSSGFASFTPVDTGRVRP